MIDIERKKAGVAWLSVLSNTTLVIAKITVGLLIGSVSVISEAIHSAVDLVASLITLFSVKTSGKPADREHPFGHGKIENISGTAEALLIFLAAGWILYESIKKLLHPEPIELLSWGVGVMLFSSLVNLIVSQMLFKVGESTDSIALKADGWHLRTDVYTSAGVMGGLGLIWLGEWLFPAADLQWVDPVIAIAVALLIIRTAYRLTLHSMQDLIDTSLPQHEEDAIRDIIGAMYPRVHGFHKLRTRKAGNTRFIEFHMQVDSKLTVEDSHFIAEEASSKIKDRLPGANVTVHVEPCNGRCESDCLRGCLLSEEERKRIREEFKSLKEVGI